jgi:simple sugar transport system permease protein
MELLSNILFATLRMGTPIVLVALAALLSQQVNLINIAVEGLMLIGAFTAVVAGAAMSSVWGGMVSAVLAGILLSVLFCLFVINLRANLIVSGLAMNTFALGITAYLLIIMFNQRGSYSPQGLPSLPTIEIPLLREIPFFGAVLSGHTILVYISWILVALVGLFLYRTQLGVHIRAVGEHQEAATSAGISVPKIQYIALLLAGAFAGLAGAQLSVGNLSLFSDNMTNGRGFIGLAAMFFGRAKPWRTFWGAMLFGLFEAIQVRLQSRFGFPPQLVQIIPYLTVVLVLTFISMREKLRARET